MCRTAIFGPFAWHQPAFYRTFQDDITAFKFKDEMNVDRMMWASKVLHDNVAGLYQLAF